MRSQTSWLFSFFSPIPERILSQIGQIATGPTSDCKTQFSKSRNTDSIQCHAKEAAAQNMYRDAKALTQLTLREFLPEASQLQEVPKMNTASIYPERYFKSRYGLRRVYESTPQELRLGDQIVELGKSERDQYSKVSDWLPSNRPTSSLECETGLNEREVERLLESLETAGLL